MPGNTSDNLASVLEAKGVKFNFHTGGVKYQAVLHKDRHSYERMKAQAAGADSSVSSTSSTDSESSAGSSAKAAN